MQRLNSLKPANAQGRTRELFDAAEQIFGTVPNTAGVMANSPAVLESSLAFGAAKGGAMIGENACLGTRL